MGSFEILERVGTLAYKVALPSGLSKIHNVFHVSTLRKYVFDASHVVELKPIHVTHRPDEVHSTCNCRDTYVYQVSL